MTHLIRAMHIGDGSFESEQLRKRPQLYALRTMLERPDKEVNIGEVRSLMHEVRTNARATVDGDTLLMLAVVRRHYKVVEMLVEEPSRAWRRAKCRELFVSLVDLIGHCFDMISLSDGEEEAPEGTSSSAAGDSRRDGAINLFGDLSDTDGGSAASRAGPEAPRGGCTRGGCAKVIALAKVGKQTDDVNVKRRQRIARLIRKVFKSSSRSLVLTKWRLCQHYNRLLFEAGLSNINTVVKGSTLIGLSSTPRKSQAPPGQARDTKSDASDAVDSLVSMSNYSGRTPLQLAVISGCLATVCLLIQHGAQLHDKDRHGHTALQLAADKDNLLIVYYLLERFHKSYNLDEVKEAFVSACMNGSLELIEYIWKWMLRNRIGRTRAAVVELLQRRPGLVERVYKSGRAKVFEFLASKGFAFERAGDAKMSATDARGDGVALRVGDIVRVGGRRALVQLSLGMLACRDGSRKRERHRTLYIIRYSEPRHRSVARKGLEDKDGGRTVRARRQKRMHKGPEVRVPPNTMCAYLLKSLQTLRDWEIPPKLVQQCEGVVIEDPGNPLLMRARDLISQSCSGDEIRTVFFGIDAEFREVEREAELRNQEFMKRFVNPLAGQTTPSSAKQNQKKVSSRRGKHYAQEYKYKCVHLDEFQELRWDLDATSRESSDWTLHFPASLNQTKSERERALMAAKPPDPDPATLYLDRPQWAFKILGLCKYVAEIPPPEQFYAPEAKAVSPHGNTFAVSRASEYIVDRNAKSPVSRQRESQSALRGARGDAADSVASRSTSSGHRILFAILHIDKAGNASDPGPDTTEDVIYDENGVAQFYHVVNVMPKKKSCDTDGKYAPRWEWRGWLFRPEHLEVTLAADGSVIDRQIKPSWRRTHSSRVHSRTSLYEITHSGVQIFREYVLADRKTRALDRSFHTRPKLVFSRKLAEDGRSTVHTVRKGGGRERVLCCTPAPDFRNLVRDGMVCIPPGGRPCTVLDSTTVIAHGDTAPQGGAGALVLRRMSRPCVAKTRSYGWVFLKQPTIVRSYDLGKLSHEPVPESARSGRIAIRWVGSSEGGGGKGDARGETPASRAPPENWLVSIGISVDQTVEDARFTLLEEAKARGDAKHLERARFVAAAVWAWVPKVGPAVILDNPGRSLREYLIPQSGAVLKALLHSQETPRGAGTILDWDGPSLRTETKWTKMQAAWQRGLALRESLGERRAASDERYLAELTLVLRQAAGKELDFHRRNGNIRAEIAVLEFLAGWSYVPEDQYASLRNGLPRRRLEWLQRAVAARYAVPRLPPSQNPNFAGMRGDDFVDVQHFLEGIHREEDAVYDRVILACRKKQTGEALETDVRALFALHRTRRLIRRTMRSARARLTHAYHLVETANAGREEKEDTAGRVRLLHGTGFVQRRKSGVTEAYLARHPHAPRPPSPECELGVVRSRVSCLRRGLQRLESQPFQLQSLHGRHVFVQGQESEREFFRLLEKEEPELEAMLLRSRRVDVRQKLRENEKTGSTQKQFSRVRGVTLHAMRALSEYEMAFELTSERHVLEAFLTLYERFRDPSWLDASNWSQRFRRDFSRTYTRFSNIYGFFELVAQYDILHAKVDHHADSGSFLAAVGERSSPGPELEWSEVDSDEEVCAKDESLPFPSLRRKKKVVLLGCETPVDQTDQPQRRPTWLAASRDSAGSGEQRRRGQVSPPRHRRHRALAAASTPNDRKAK